MKIRVTHKNIIILSKERIDREYVLQNYLITFDTGYKIIQSMRFNSCLSQWFYGLDPHLRLILTDENKTGSRKYIDSRIGI